MLGDTAILFKLQQAVLAARERCSDSRLGTQLRKGKLQVVRVFFSPNGLPTVLPVSDWLEPEAAVAYIHALQPEDLPV